MSTIAPSTRAAAFSETRNRIVSASYELFSQRSTRDVAMDEVVAVSGVAKATLYRHFATKDDLVLAFLERREEVWTLGVVEGGAMARADDPEGRLLAIFDVFDEWFQRDDYEACTFVNVLLEMGADHPLGRASAGYLSNIRGMVSRFAEDAGLRDPEEFAFSWHILMKGSIVQAAEGDRRAAVRAQTMGAALIESYRA
ncbi:TetR/AcrR family transcriptional regulator [Glaciihabitans sp. UYNi722]|uniref:TetR/AcrR family transcriptional regulator n=1 Tax=Glaciihabitans sp. UYNi722 TaxID=3156344 RepID=UPI0033997853